MEEGNDPKGKKIRWEVQDEGDAEKIKQASLARTWCVGFRGHQPPCSLALSDPLNDYWHWLFRLSALRVPNKCKQFIQLACEEWNHIVKCSRCVGVVESTMHCLKECPHASEVWSMSQLSSIVVHQSALTFGEFFRDVTRVLKDDHRGLSLFVLICWSLWEARNEHKEKHITQDPADTLDKALLHLEQTTSLWERDKLLILTNRELALSRPRTWSPPPKGWVKLNVEAINLTHAMAMGMVVRNNNGRVLTAIGVCYRPEKDLLTAKALALERALETGFRYGHNIVLLQYQKVLVELTSNLIVECLAKFEHIRSDLCDELHHTLEISLSTASLFSEMKFAKVSARENRLAYCMASKILLQEPCDTTDDPVWLKEAIAADFPN